MAKEFVWNPTDEWKSKSYLNDLFKEYNTESCTELRRKTLENYPKFWEENLRRFDVYWHKTYSSVLNLSRGFEFAKWFEGGETSLAFHCLDRHYQAQKDRTALVWKSEQTSSDSVTYEQLFRAVNSFSTSLLQLGFSQGDSLGLLMPMCPEAIYALLACFQIGVKAVPVFSGFASQAIADRFLDAKVKGVIACDETFRRGKRVDILQTVRELQLKLPEETFYLIQKRNTSRPLNSREKEANSLFKQMVTLSNTRFFPSETPAIILYTSGTTGKPKGVIHTHVGCLSQIPKEHRYSFQTGSDSRFFWFTDMGWMMGPWEIIGVTFFGGTLCLYEGAPDFPTSDALWRFVDESNVTTLGVSPTLIRAFKDEEIVRRFLFSNLQVLGSTGEPWDPSSYRWFYEHVGKKRCPIINISGGTEIIGCFLTPFPVEPLSSCSLGGPALGVDLEVYGESGKPVSNEIGHLVCQKPIPSMTKGFVGDDSRYLDTYFRRFPGTWYHGDWAKRDIENEWFLFGRSDDTIKIAGKRVGPAEYEAALAKHPGVLEAAVIGLPDSVKGEKAIAFVKFSTQTSQSDIEALHTLVISDLGKALALSEIYFVSELPKTRSGKIVRGVIKAVVSGKKEIDTSAVENPLSLRGFPRLLIS